LSYDIELRDPVTNKVLKLDAPHHMRGGTYCVGGTTDVCLNVTYNYSTILYRVIDGGIRGLYGKTGAESIPLLKTAIAQLGDDTDPDYWEATEGNVKAALLKVLALAQMRPDGVWAGD
jgi:hypothetical protein